MKPRGKQAGEEIRKLIGYLEENAGRVDYGPLRKGGYPIGNGGIESANKAISHVRLKRSGAWWYVEQANQMLVLRCAEYNGTFDKIFKAYQRSMLPDPDSSESYETRNAPYDGALPRTAVIPESPFTVDEADA